MKQYTRLKSVGLMASLLAALWAFSAPALALKDPTRPPGFGGAPSKAVPKTSLAVQSILVGNGRKVAVINGEPRAEGQSFGKIRVRRILRDRVEVLDHGRLRTLYLEQLPQVRRTQ
ncbi:hypothetical protein QVZ43_15795 [Marinobacter sp. chi1]|uniref:MSHA biogenesis protein MshK n=1 Tax=Marinobacter suaedae TaxID=3057675 RepID=A0ABT8W4L0_9GAMM|nr:hypothetical protein [Marinobacter sp. chi1]MDO3723179.1 hypothetical protein [Marinobacter sp. chi1]